MLAINILLFSFVLVIGFSWEYSVASDLPVPNNSYESAPTVENDPVFPNLTIAEDFFKKAYENPNTKGWILIPNVCYYPVMYSSDNSFYLKHDSEDKYAKQGSIFLNGNGNPDFNSNVTLIHGHHMKVGTMFGKLKNYQESKDFFQTNPPIEIFDGEKIMYYKPFTVFLMKDGVEYIELDEKSPEEHSTYMNSFFERSKYEMKNPDDFNPEAKCIFLSTCDYSFDNARLVVGAYLIDSIDYKD